ncbi:MAG: C4-dicarboxylate ABC transporter [Gammaproteobacteria bacterium]|nr:MAG: C4-dicarboxylate ABC transporter [Gammaproteobacteria bacterium]
MNNINQRLANMPISFFAIIMGLGGFTLAWERATTMLQFPFISFYLYYFTFFMFVVLLVMYFIKIIKYPQEVLKELKSPIKLSFFPTTSISILLLATAGIHINPELSKYLWMIGAGLHFAWTLFILSAWINRDIDIKFINPAWFIPAVGNIIVPIAGVHYGFVNLSYFFFDLGLLYWLILFTIVFYRIIFHHPMADKLLPTLFIFIAPPALGFISYVQLTGLTQIDFFAQFLYNSALFLTIFLLLQFNKLIKLKFYLSWWAYSFPLAAMTIATFLMAKLSGFLFYKVLFGILLTILTLLIILLSIKTIKAMLNKSICIEE